MSDEREQDAAARRARRAWIAAHHPDRGGDPAAFDEGLRRITRSDPERVSRKPTVHRSRSPLRRLQRLVRQVQRARRGLPPRRLD